MNITEIVREQDLDPLRDRWDSISGSNPSNHPWLTFDWYREWVRCHGNQSRPFVLVVEDNGQAVAIAPLVRSQITRHAVRLRKIGFIVEEFTGEFLVSADDTGKYIKVVLDHLSSIRESWDVLFFKKIRLQSMATETLKRVAVERGFRLAEDTNSWTPYLEINRDWDSYYASLSHNFRKNLRRSLERLQKRGAVSVRRYSRPEELDSALGVIYDIAKKSWQGQKGTDISSEDADRPFYERFAGIMAKKGRLDLRVLMVGDRAAAFEYNVRQGGTVYAVKCGYDPEFADCSPGVYLRRLTNEDYFKEGICEIDFMGVHQFFISRWTDKTRPHIDVMIYNVGVKTAFPYFVEAKLYPLLKRFETVRRIKKYFDKTKTSPHFEVGSKIKIGYMIDHIDSDLGGTEKQLLEIIRRLDRSRFEPYLICLKDTEWIKRSSLPCPHRVLGFEGFIKMGLHRSLWRFRKLMLEEKFDVVQTFFEDSIFFCFLATLFGPRPRVLLSSRRDIGLLNQPWYHKLYKLIMPLINLRFDGIVANGHNIKKHVMAKEKASAAKIKVISNGMEMPKEDAFVPGLFHKDKPALWIGIAANFNPVKRIDVFLNALALLRDKHNVRDFKAVHLGDGPDREEMTLLRSKLGLEEQVIFEGSVKNVGAYLRQLDIAVLCSDREGLSNAILEYMGHSLPVVATAVGGNTELVDDSNGICVPPGDPEALAEALKTLALNPEKRKSMGQASRRKVEGVYSWPNSMREWENYYKGLVRR